MSKQSFISELRVLTYSLPLESSGSFIVAYFRGVFLSMPDSYLILMNFSLSEKDISPMQVQLRARPARAGERNSVNQCINEISSSLTEAARRRCNSEVVRRSDEQNCECIKLCYLMFA